MVTDGLAYVLRHLRRIAAGPASGDLSDGELALFTATALLFAGLAIGAGFAARQLLAERPVTVAADQNASPPEGADRRTHGAPRTDRYGDPLPAGAVARLGTLRLREGDYIESLHFTPDGKVLVARWNGGAGTWETATGKRLQRFPKEAAGGNPAGAALSPDGKRLATPGANSLQIWETATAKLLQTITVDTGNHRGPYLSACFSADGTLLASQRGGELNQVALWDPATGRLLRSWAAGERRVIFLAFAGRGKTLITVSEDNSIRAWDARTGKQDRETVKLPYPILSLSLSPDGKRLVTTGYTAKNAGPGVTMHVPQGFARVWDVTTGKELRRVDQPAEHQKDEHTRGFRAFAFTRDGKSLLAGGGDGSLYVCPVTGRQGPQRLWRGAGSIGAITASPDGKTAAVATGAAIHLLDLSSGKDVFSHLNHPGTAYKTAVTPDGRTALIASGADLYLRDLASGRLRKRLQGHHGYINGIQLIDGGRKAVTSAYQDGTLLVWDVVAGRQAGRIESSDKTNILQAVSPDGKTVVVGGSNSFVVLFDAHTGKEIQRLKGPGNWGVYGAAFTPDGRTLVVWYTTDNLVYHWDLATGKKIREYSFIDGDPPQPNPPGQGRPVYEVAVSPDGRLIAFGSQSRFLEVRDLASGMVLYRRNQLPDGVCPLAFSPDSRMLAWSGWWNDPTVHVVEVATGKDRCRFAGHAGRVLSLSFSADCTRLISGSADTTALVWDLTGKRAAGEKWGEPPSSKEIEAAWAELAGADAGRAYEAVCRLSAAPREAVALLGRHLRPVPAADEKRLAGLIAALDADEFTVREKASRELEALGEGAAAACHKALEGHPSAEARRRLERLRNKQLREMVQTSPDRLRSLRALEILERAGTAEARQLLKNLAAGAAGARLTREARAALERRMKF
jgi:WD40 repeat protein